MLWTDVTRRQGGLVSRRQLAALAYPGAAVDSLLRSRRLVRTRADAVYRAAGAPITGETPAWFAVLSTNAPLSFVSAAQWWELPVEEDGLVHVTRLDRKRLVWPPGVRIHRVGLDRSAVVEHRGLAVTSRRETVLDCIGWLDRVRAQTLADRALQQHWIELDDIDRRLEGQPGRWGNRQLRRTAARLGDGAAAESERRLHRLLRRAGIRGWVANLPLLADGQHVVIDVAFPGAKIAIEVDGFEYHSRSGRFQRDRTRQNALMSAGWRVLRFTWADLAERPDYVIATILQLLAS